MIRFLDKADKSPGVFVVVVVVDDDWESIQGIGGFILLTLQEISV